MEKEHTKKVLNLLVVLNGTIRQNIIEQLKKGDNNATAIGKILKCDASHISYNLTMLSKYGIVHSQWKNFCKCYRLDQDRVKQLQEAVEQFNQLL